MARHHDLPKPLPLARAFEMLNNDHLKPLVQLLTSKPPTRKGELVAILVQHLSDPKEVRRLYDQLDQLGKLAVQEAAHHPHGLLDLERFLAHHGNRPTFYRPSDKESSYSRYDSYKRPTTLALFFPQGAILPTDLHRILREFVPRPPAFALPTGVMPPATVEHIKYEWKGSKRIEQTVQVPVRIRETAREAEHDLAAVLRLCEAGQISVSDKKQQPTAASLKVITKVLQNGDFYTPEDQGDFEYDPASDLTIKAFAWPMLVQAAGLGEKSGGRLKLSTAGKKALTQPPQITLRTIWKKWCGNKLLDEFNRVEAIKGQGKAQLSALVDRRKNIVSGLAACPLDSWVPVNDFFRLLRVTDRNFVLAHRVENLYIGENYYGNFGYFSSADWPILQGRYVLAFLLEYAATAGLIDVAYVPPQQGRADFGKHWGTDDMSCLSRYDGLLYFRLNPLGAYCLGVTSEYQAPPLQQVERFQVLPNLDLVLKNPPLPPLDQLLLERYAEPQADLVWKLTPAKALAVLEEGGSVNDLEEFLQTRTTGPLPQTVSVFLNDLRQRGERLRDRGLVRLLECSEPALARELAADPQLKKLCQLAGDRGLIFESKDETAVRKALKKLGHVLPKE